MYISEDWRLRVASVCLFQVISRFVFLFFFFLFQQACRAAPTSSGVYQLRAPPHTALPVFIASLRHGHEVGGDAVSEVKTIRAAAIGPRRRSRPR